jgi:flagellar protein FlgJ
VAITPPSDIVLGVTLAADPEQYRAAADRLRQLSEIRAAAASNTPSPASERMAQRMAPATTAPAPGGSAATRPAKAGDVFGQLEAFVLQSFIQAMLPKNAENVFGKGAAGDVWKSMLAEKLAGEMARSGQVGLAKHLAAGRAGMPAVAPASLSSVLPYLQPEPSHAPRRAAAPATDAVSLIEKS